MKVNVEWNAKEKIMFAKHSITAILTLAMLASAFADPAPFPTFHGEEIDKSLKIGYAVKIVDLNADGKPDIVLTDVGDQLMDILTYSGKPDLNRAISFKVFERKSFRGGVDSTEPRDRSGA